MLRTVTQLTEEKTRLDAQRASPLRPYRPAVQLARLCWLEDAVLSRIATYRQPPNCNVSGRIRNRLRFCQMVLSHTLSPR